ncbi:C4-dicarboxylate TRAP transporter large permease protein DctM [bioreactor metagenome]|uniref:C4-dicarboxylate TRAP transporter large permease protein DctM n=1 Tax=bioreactor metagenome TaxID=1076179 RepID=A0A645GI42_9ZZZZ
MLAVATAFSRYVTLQQIPAKVASFIMGITSNELIIMLLINLFLLLVGCVVDNIPALTILAPILLPLAQQCGLSTIEFGVVIVLNTCIGLITPPYGPSLYLGNMIAKSKFEDSIKYLIPMFIAMVAVLMLLTYVPSISSILL